MTPETSSPTDETLAPATTDFRRLLLSLVLVFGFLIVILGGFYLEENWRGKHGWEKTKERLAARGEKLEWSDYLRTPPPDESNMMKAPLMEAMLVRGQTGALTIGTIPAGVLDRSGKVINWLPGERPARPRFAIVHVVSSADRVSPDAQIIDFKPTAIEATQHAISSGIIGRHLPMPQGLDLVERPFGEDVRHVYLRSSTALSTNELWKVLSGKTVSPTPSGMEQIEPNTYALLAPTSGWYGAEQWIAWSETEMVGLNALHEAAKRPDCWLPGDYSIPFEAPMVNFVAARTLAQFAGSRADAFILLNKPNEAMAELKRMDEITRVLSAEPQTLVSAMINVAITGLKEAIVENGFRFGTWKEEHWRELLTWSTNVELLTPVVSAMRGGERASVCYLLEKTPEAVHRLMGASPPSGLQDPMSASWRLLPKGWYYQNLTMYANLVQDAVDAIDPRARTIDRSGINAMASRIEDMSVSRSPTTALVKLVTPNMTKAAQTMGKNQTRARMAGVAAALELYRSEHGAYPNSLSELTPKYLQAEPREVVSRAPLKYSRRNNGQYALYSIGWDQVDSFGKTLAAYPNATIADLVVVDMSGKDWVWDGVPEPKKGADKSK